MTVMFIVGMLLIVGAILVGGSRSRGKRKSRARSTSICGACRHRNLSDAKFCARCGEALRNDQST